MRSGARILLAFEGLNMDGGVASVSRSFARVFDDAVEKGIVERVDRCLLHDHPEAPPPSPLRGSQQCMGGSKVRFLFELHGRAPFRGYDWVLFDHLGVGRVAAWPLPTAPRRYAVMVHGTELEAVTPSNVFARALLRADLILTNSRFTARRVVRLLPALRDRVRPLRLCIEPSRVDAWERDASVREQPRRRERAALIVGRMWSSQKGKGHDGLIKAWPLVLEQVPDAQLWIAGGGDDRPRLERLADEVGAAERIQFLGRVDDAALTDLYRRASVLAMPSSQEGFGLVYLEAMWHGLPCIGSTSDAATEVIADGETGVLVTYGDPSSIARGVSSLLMDSDRVVRMGEAGVRRAREEYSYEWFRQDLLEAMGLGGGGR